LPTNIFYLQILGIIPARYASSRFPGKPLVSIAGKTMIQRVYEQCQQSAYLSKVIVATDDMRIAAAVQEFGGEVIMTANTHNNGTSRCSEVILELPEAYDYIINIQGDEPLIHPGQIDKIARIFQENKAITIATLVKQQTADVLSKSPNIVKAILDKDYFAVDFTRELAENAPFFYKHIGIYGFQTNTLHALTKLTPTVNELKYHLEQLRWLDNGYRIKVALTNEESISVDVPEDIERVIKAIQDQDL